MKWLVFHINRDDAPVISTPDEKPGACFQISHLVTAPTAGHQLVYNAKNAFSWGKTGRGVLLNTNGPARPCLFQAATTFPSFNWMIRWK